MAAAVVFFRRRGRAFPTKNESLSPSEAESVRPGPNASESSAAFQPVREARVEPISLPRTESTPTAIPDAKPVSLKTALGATRQKLFGGIANLFSGGSGSEEIWERLEEALFLSDMGSPTVQRLLQATQDHFSILSPPSNEDMVRGVLRDEILKIFGEVPTAPETTAESKTAQVPEVWLVVGVNGVGKTTTIGKLAAQWASEGHRVLIGAGDTFRAAAESQLAAWAQRAEVEIFTSTQTRDPAAVAFAALQEAKAKGFNKVIIDTAGRLHTAQGLMDELKKIKRVLGNLQQGAPQATVLVVDASQGQNALVQAKQFHQAIELSGVILTKMDGTAKGGVAVGIAEEIKLPIIYIGVGEKVADLRPFAPKEFVEAII